MSSHSYELGWLEGAARQALIEIERGNSAEAIKVLKFGLDEAQRKGAYERECVSHLIAGGAHVH